MIAFSGDGGYVITGIVGQAGAELRQTGPDVEHPGLGAPIRATGSETPYTDTIVLSDVQGGQFTEVSSTRDSHCDGKGLTLNRSQAPSRERAVSHPPYSAPAAPSGTDCGDGVYAGPNTKPSVRVRR